MSLVLDIEVSRDDAWVYAEDLQLRIFCDQRPSFNSTVHMYYAAGETYR